MAKQSALILCMKCGVKFATDPIEWTDENTEAFLMECPNCRHPAKSDDIISMNAYRSTLEYRRSLK